MKHIVVLCSVLALMYGNVDAIKVADQSNNENKTPLLEVHEKKTSSIDEQFLKLSEEDKTRGWFDLIESQEFFDCARYFVHNGFDINTKNKQGKTSLIIVCEKGNPDIVKYLLKYNADPNLAAQSGATPLSIAVEKKNPEIVKMLMETGVVQVSPYEEEMAKKYLSEAAEYVENIKNALSSLKKAKELNKSEGEDETLQDIINSIAKSEKVLEEKLKEIDDWSEIIEMFEKSKKLPLFSSNIDEIKAGIERGDDVNIIRNENGNTPLTQAVINRSAEIVTYLLDHGADPNKQDNHRTLPLSLAVLMNEPEIAQVLLDKGANPDLSDNFGPLKRLASILLEKTTDEVAKAVWERIVNYKNV